MKDVLLGLLGPVLGLVGTALGIWIGQNRWKREQSTKEEALYKDNVRSTYLELWNVVEEAHIKMRESLDGLTAERFSGFMADVNNFMIRRGLYIERQDRGHHTHSRCFQR